jgi:phosphoribosylformylglycinamidine synthase subunit PurS
MKYRVRIHVTLKPSVLDPQGAAVVRALGSLGFDEVEDVRAGKYLELRLSARDDEMARARVAAMCETLLANTVIERYEFTLEADSSVPPSFDLHAPADELALQRSSPPSHCNGKGDGGLGPRP